MKTWVVGLTLAFISLALAPGDLGARVYIDLQAPSVKKLPLAIQSFKYTGPDPESPERAELVGRVAAELHSTLSSDLRFSGLFELIPAEAFLEDSERFGLTLAETNFSEWRVIGADAVIKAGFRMEGERLVVEARFFDSIRETQLLGKRYIGRVENPKRLAHYFADQLYEELTGRPGVFSTRLLFVSDRTGNKEIYLSDYDGRDAVQITRNGSINLSPRWDPEGKAVYYTSYKGGTPSTYRLSLITGADERVSNRKGINIGARPSPDGSALALTLSIDDSPQLYLLDLESRRYKRLTRSWGIDVSPTWSPDGRKLAFVSDRAGNPHIFVLDLATGKVKRLTYNGKYNASPAWSPDGKTIAYASSDGRSFDIYVTDPRGRDTRRLTYTGGNKSPSWSPDGRFIVFSSTRRRTTTLRIMQADGSGQRVLKTGVGGEKTPAWSPYLK